jgi:hypothetical protein
MQTCKKAAISFMNNLAIRAARFAFVVSLAGCLFGCAHQPAMTIGGPSEPNFPWRANPTLPGVSSAVGVGNPAQPGLYAMFGRMERGARFPPHTHPDGRLTTVIYGTMYLGMGDVFDESNVVAYAQGSVVFTPANAAHYMWAKDGVVIMQEAGAGPTAMTISKSP